MLIPFSNVSKLFQLPYNRCQVLNLQKESVFHRLEGKCFDVASDVGVNFKNVGVLSIESSLFHLSHYTFLQTKHQRKGY